MFHGEREFEASFELSSDEPKVYDVTARIEFSEKSNDRVFRRDFEIPLGTAVTFVEYFLLTFFVLYIESKNTCTGLSKYLLDTLAGENFRFNSISLSSINFVEPR